jgi:hypothetical protein
MVDFLDVQYNIYADKINEYIAYGIIPFNKKNKWSLIHAKDFASNFSKIINSNKISRDNLLGILKNNSIDNGRRYTLLTILKYNVTLDADDIKGFLKDDISYNFLQKIKGEALTRETQLQDTERNIKTRNIELAVWSVFTAIFLLIVITYLRNVKRL